MGAFGSQFLKDQFHWSVPWWIIKRAHDCGDLVHRH